MTRNPYPSDVSDDEWSSRSSLPISPYLTEDAPQRDYSLGEVFNGLRWLARSASQWQMTLYDLPHWHSLPADATLTQSAGV
jgi:transposase